MSGPLDLRLMDRGRARRLESSVESCSVSEASLDGAAKMVSVMLPMGVMGRGPGGEFVVVSVIVQVVGGAVGTTKVSPLDKIFMDGCSSVIPSVHCSTEYYGEMVVCV